MNERARGLGMKRHHLCQLLWSLIRKGTWTKRLRRRPYVRETHRKPSRNPKLLHHLDGKTSPMSRQREVRKFGLTNTNKTSSGSMSFATRIKDRFHQFSPNTACLPTAEKDGLETDRRRHGRRPITKCALQMPPRF